MTIRPQAVAALKLKRKQLLKEAGISMRTFKKKMPRVKNKKNGDFDVSETGIGKKPSLWQQVVWLKEYVEATAELRKEIKDLREQKEKGDSNER